jgi:hypothetical protein
MIVKVCSKCGKERTHRMRSDKRDAPRTSCINCEADKAREWRKTAWQQRKLRDTWKGMVNRCHNPEAMRRWALASGVPKVRDYAEAGITVCDRWRGADGFKHFCEDMGPPPTPEHTLDRKNTRRGYSPRNCRWADKATQAANRKNSRWVQAKDPKTGALVWRTLSDWARTTGVDRRYIARRLNAGWPADKAVSHGAKTAPF